MNTFIVKWHAVVTILGQSKAFSGVQVIEAANQIEAIAQVQGNIYRAKPDPIELNIDEVMEIAS